jgi:hypothetical protein
MEQQMTTTNPFTADITSDVAARIFTNRELAQFHAYNPNGLMAQWGKLGTRLLDFGRGFLAYGDTGFYYNELHRIARLQRVNRFALQATLKGIERSIAKGEAFLAENAQRPARRVNHMPGPRAPATTTATPPAGQA